MPTKTAPPFASHLLALRQARGLSRQQLADAVGCSKMQIWRLERGLCQPRLDTLRKLAAALGVTLNGLGEAS